MSNRNKSTRFYWVSIKTDTEHSFGYKVLVDIINKHALSQGFTAEDADKIVIENNTLMLRFDTEAREDTDRRRSNG